MKRRMRPVDSVFFSAYDAAWRLLLPMLRRHHRLAEGFEQRALVRPPAAPVDIWIQAASGGEAYLAWELLKRMTADPPLAVQLTTNTRQGMDILKRAAADVTVENGAPVVHTAYFPFDRPRWMQKTLGRLRPRVVVLLETEIWPALLAALKCHGGRSLIVNARMTAGSLARYRLWPSLWRSLAPDGVLAVSRTDAARFGALFGGGRVAVMPNIKFDRLRMPASVDAPPPAAGWPPAARPFVVFGSVRRKEEADVLRIICTLRKACPDVVIGLFPRHLHRIAFWRRALARRRIGVVLRSQAASPAVPGHLILGDVFGELDAAYAAAVAAFVGGSLAPLGGQNFLEPLVNGVAPVIGPHWDNFRWVGSELIQSGLVRQVNDWKGVVKALINDVNNPRNPDGVRRAAAAYIKTRQGGTLQAVERIRRYL